MGIILPIAAFLSVFVYWLSEGFDFRKSWITSTLIIFSFVALTTELLGKFSLINRSAVTLLWMGFLLFFAFLIIRSPKKVFTENTAKAFHIGGWGLLKPLIVILFLILLIISLKSYPNNWDSMTYHLARIVHWIQNQNLDFYPTGILRQLQFPPLAEIMMMHLYLLTGNERMMNLIQWFSYVSMVITIPLLFEEFGKSNKGKILSQVLAMIVPMAILQATSTQNDVLTGYLVLVSIWLFFRLRKARTFFNAILFGIAVALSFYTKTTAYIFLAPLLVWTAFEYLKKPQPKKILIHGTIFLLVILLINGPYFLRNYELWGTPLGTDHDDTHLNRKFTVTYTASNLIRNVFMQFESPNYNVNKAVFNSADSLIKFLNVSPNNPDNTFSGEKFGDYISPFVIFHPDYAPNPIPMALIIISTIAVFVFERKNMNLVGYTLYTISTILLFSLLLKWQPWQSRLLLPFFLIFCPIEAYVLDELPSETVGVMVVAIMLLAAPYVYGNSMRRLTGRNSILVQNRNDQYFNGRPYVMKDYSSLIDKVKKTGCRKVGLNINPDDYEYPIWAMLKGDSVIIEHSGVTNESKIYYRNRKFRDFKPCIIFNANEKDQYSITEIKSGKNE